MKIGVLSLQGDYPEHVWALDKVYREYNINGEIIKIKDKDALDRVDGVILPGGESTTIGKLLIRAGLIDRLKKAIEENRLPTLATCAGAILLARKIRDRVVGETKQPLIGVMDISIVRNVFGRQKNSFEADIEIDNIGMVRAVFIRAPGIIDAWGSARILGYIDHPEIGKIGVAAEQNNIIATAFHPELSGDISIHRYFIDLIKK